MKYYHKNENVCLINNDLLSYRSMDTQQSKLDLERKINSRIEILKGTWVIEFGKVPFRSHLSPRYRNAHKYLAKFF